MDNNNLYKWLYIPPNVYVQEGEKATFLLYDTQTGEFMISTDIELCNVVKEVYIPENLGVIKYEQENIKTNDFKKAVEKSLIKTMPIKNEKIKPVNFLPILNLQNDFSKYDNSDEAPHLRKNVTRFLSGLNIYLSYSKDFSISEEKDFRNIVSKQVLLPPLGDSEQYIELNEINTVLLQVAHSSVKKIDIIPGNTYFKKVNQRDFINLLSIFDFEYHIHLHINDFLVLIQDFNQTTQNFLFTIYIDKFSSEENINKITSLNFENIFQIQCLITCEEEFVFFQKIPVIYQNKDKINFFPVWTNKNIDFFEKNILLSIEDLSKNPVSMHEIFRNRKLNANFFGILSVLPDKSVYAHGGKIILGNIINTPLAELVYKELKLNTSWRKTRDLTPCKKCFFCYLCPPVSIYETIFNKYKSCNMENAYSFE